MLGNAVGCLFTQYLLISKLHAYLRDTRHGEGGACLLPEGLHSYIEGSQEDVTVTEIDGIW